MRSRALAAMVTMGLLLGGFGLTTPATAQEDMPKAEAQVPAEKLGRGLHNTILGWTELVARPQAEAEEKGAVGVVTGLVNGVATGTVRTVTGAAEVATFWSPLPVKYQPPVKEPASPWDRR